MKHILKKHTQKIIWAGLWIGIFIVLIILYWLFIKNSNNLWISDIEGIEITSEWSTGSVQWELPGGTQTSENLLWL